MANAKPIPGFGSAIELPPELLQDPDVLSFITEAVTQWSRIAAWSWCDFLAFEADPKKANAENTLKELLRIALHEQARNSDAYIAYGNEQTKVQANNWSLVIQNLLVGDNQAAQALLPDGDKFKAFKNMDLEVTLNDYTFQVTKQELVASKPQNRKYVDMFYVQVITGSFGGKVIKAPKSTATSETQYINVFAYPPRPVIGPIV